MRKLLLTGLLLTGLLAAVAAGCGSPNPAGPGIVTVTQTTTSTTTTTVPPTTSTTTSTTTTSTILPTGAARRYLAFGVAPNVPKDMTLFFQLDGPFLYSVTGVYSTGSGIGGVVSGFLSGGNNPTESGVFDGTLTAEFPGCTSQRVYTGPLTSQGLQFTAGRILNDCPQSTVQPWPASFTMLKADVINGAVPVRVN
jgi:hypothetical protein